MGERGMWGKSNMYEEAAAVPMIMAGPDVPGGKVSKTPVSLADVFPTVLDCAGLKADDPDLRGRSLFEIAREDDCPNRAVFSEYHAAGAISGAFMIRKGPWKYIYYSGLAPQLFNLDTDPGEVDDLGTSAEHEAILADLHAELLKVCDPDAVDRRAKADQAVIIEKHGGVEAVLERGGFGATPAPGAKAAFVASNGTSA